MNSKIFRAPGGLMSRSPNLPLALRASVGADGGGGGARPTPAGRAAPAPAPTRQPAPQLSAGVGWEAHPNARAMAQMAVAVGAQGIGGDALNPQRCIPQYPGQVVASMEGISCPPENYDVAPPPGVDQATYRYIMAQINLAKYATAPTRLGWLCDSIAYVTPNLVAAQSPTIAANALFGALSLTPTRSFTMDAFVMASGTSNDPLYFVTNFTYGGVNYVGSGPWISTLYTPTSGCCLCVRVVPIIEKNTTIAISGQNGNVANVYLFGELFGYTLFSGSP